jgi:ABC-type multidrug transport system ATPase subunit
LTKIYPSNLKSKDPKKRNKKSLNNFTIHLNDSEIFGLLGPNGAGKTTFFSILTGIYEPTSGNAFIRGNSIIKNIEKTYQYIGYCPQFDLLWEDLSVENTLLFYSRMKNKEESKIKFMVEKILDDVKLKKFRKYLVRELSGGMRRRLTLGVALVGEPPIVFLDEPTTGLDPKNKREIWDILSHCKENRCMILTTHLMDEAETLCDRIGIILKGKIRCLGSQYKLKTSYGKGFKLCMNLKPFTVDSIYDNNDDEDIIGENKEKKIGFFFDKNKIKEQNRINESRINKISDFLNEIFTKNCTLMEKHRSAVIYEIGTDVFNPGLLFDKLEQNKEELEITNWAISQVDLEDIFIKLTENDL